MTNVNRTSSDNTKPFGKRFGTHSLILAAIAIIGLAAGHAFAQSDSNDVFLIKPYVQLGNEPKLKKAESMEVVWFSVADTDDDDEWVVEYQSATENKWRVGKHTDSTTMGAIAGKQFFRHTVTLSDLKPGETFNYRFLKDEKQVFQASSTARKAFNQPYRFAVVGDVGAGSPGQKKVVHQLLQQHPDFLMIPGDIVYNFGLMSEYLARFFPIMNSDTDSPTIGAPFLRSVLTMTAIGNHDIALTEAGDGTDFTRFPDALGYYLFWSQPLDGPNKVINGKNTTRIKGDANNQLGFAKAAGKRFPVMANYSFDYGNSHWIVLDGNPYMDWTDAKTRKWVEEDLAKAKNATWKFASFHQPGFSVDEAHATEQRMRLLSDIFEKHKVDVVFSGHAHCYQRTRPLKFKPDLTGLKGPYHEAINGSFTLDKNFDGKTKTVPDGVLYIITGGGGAKLYSKSKTLAMEPFVDKYVYSYCFTLCDVKDKTLQVSQISLDGKVLDQFSLTKGIMNAPQIGKITSPETQSASEIPQSVQQ